MEIKAHHLSINPFSRPGVNLEQLKSIVIHWVANASTGAIANRNYFENRKDGRSGYGSAHYIVGLDGEVLECVPPAEVAYHVGSKSYTRFTRDFLTLGNPNNYTLGVELCHPRPDGVFSDVTFNAAAKLCAELCKDNSLNPYMHITTHKAVVGWKDCPKHWCKDPGELQRFQRTVGERMRLC